MSFSTSSEPGVLHAAHPTLVRRIRRYYPNVPDAQMDRFAELLRVAAQLSDNLPAIRVVPRDPTADMIVATAVKEGGLHRDR